MFNEPITFFTADPSLLMSLQQGFTCFSEWVQTKMGEAIDW